MKPRSPDLATPSEWHYAPVAVTLHWLLAILIVGMLALGVYMVSIEDEPGADRYFHMHESVGIVVFALVLARLAWRLTHRPAGLPASVPRWEATATTVVERLLYVCMIAQPVIGFLGASYTKSGIVFFGLHLPAWHQPDHDTAQTLFGVHAAIASVLAVLAAVHALGGLKHLLINRDRIFQRMWF